jgi:DNA-binding transcriptional MerR regulator
MFRVGEFSRISRVTIDTLRHYDALGLLKPEKVDSFTGYRYYSARQLQSLNRILVLKEVGFSLEEIARILRDQPTREELRGMLKAQLARAENEIRTARERRELILTRLNTLNLEENMPAYEVNLKPVERLTVAAIREVVPVIEQMPRRCGEMFDTIAKWLIANNLSFGPAMTVYYNEGFVRENIDTECAFLLSDARPAKAAKQDELVKIKEMDAVPLMASTIVTDDFYNKVDGLTPAYTSLAQWIEQNGYRIIGPPRELFYGSVQNGDLTAEIQFPVEKA